MDAKQYVRVTADISATWDGVDHDLSEGIVIQYGVVELWKKINPNVAFTVSEVASEDFTPNKPIINPLEENDRGEAFSGLKRRGRSKN